MKRRKWSMTQKNVHQLHYQEHRACYPEVSKKSDEEFTRPSDLGMEAMSSHSPSLFKHRKGDISPSFINPSPQELSSEDGEEDARSDHSRDDDGDEREQHSVKRRSHKQQHRHPHSSHEDGKEGSHSIPSGTSTGHGIMLAGEETPLHLWASHYHLSLTQMFLQRLRNVLQLQQKGTLILMKTQNIYL